MKNYLKTMIVALVLATNVSAQTNDTEFDTIETHANINPTTYIKAINHMFKFDTLCSDVVLVTRIGDHRVKNRYIYCSKVRLYLIKHYYKHNEQIFKLNTEVNNGYIFVISQYRNDLDIPIRYFTFFIDQTTKKITVIEIEENEDLTPSD